MYRNTKAFVCVFVFLGAIIPANLLVAHYGQKALPFTAFFLIPFDMLTRDILHEVWKKESLWTKMSALIFTGSVLSYLLNQDAKGVAIASFVAFASAGFMNAIVYALMDKERLLVKMNTSNFFCAVTDSIVFPFVAFGGTDWGLSAAQAGTKFAGGFVWSYLYWRAKNRYAL